MRSLILALVFSCSLAASRAWFSARARDGISGETGIKAWGPSGPQVVWSRDVGPGYAGPVILGERLIVFHRVGDEEVVECCAPTPASRCGRPRIHRVSGRLRQGQRTTRPRR